MSDEHYYPELDPKTMRNISVIQKLAADHPSYWLKAPYSGEIQMQLEALFKKSKTTSRTQEPPPPQGIEDDGKDNWQFLFDESKTLYRNLKGAQPSGDEPTAQMGYFRTATALLEKLLAMQERALNLKQVSDFYQTVLDVMESALSPAQRTEIIARLQEASKGT